MSLKIDDLLILLSLARHRTFSSVGAELGLNHTTVARRIASLSKEMGGRLISEANLGWDLTPLGQEVVQVAEKIQASLAELPNGDVRRSATGLRGVVRVSATEVFGLKIVAPALALVHARHPGIILELASITRPSTAHGPSADIDIGITRPTSSRLVTKEIWKYSLGLYATREYLEQHGVPQKLDELAKHNLIWYVDGLLQLNELDVINEFLPQHRDVIGATSPLVHLELTRLGAGVGILPEALVRDSPDLINVLPSHFSPSLTYWMASRPESLSRPEVSETARAILSVAETYHTSAEA